MADLAAAANITFVPRTSEPNWIRFFNSTGNNSYVGMIGGQQAVNIASWTYRFIIVHELRHAMGFWHEQQRPDRDAFVTINWANIQTAYASNFNTLPGATTVGSYDFDSVMHYDQCAFSIDCPPGYTCGCSHHVIDVLPPYAASQSGLGQRAHLSIGDAVGAASHYGAAIAPVIASFAPTTAAPNTFLTITIIGSRFCAGEHRWPGRPRDCRDLGWCGGTGVLHVRDSG